MKDNSELNARIRQFQAGTDGHMQTLRKLTRGTGKYGYKSYGSSRLSGLVDTRIDSREYAPDDYSTCGYNDGSDYYGSCGYSGGSDYYGACGYNEGDYGSCGVIDHSYDAKILFHEPKNRRSSRSSRSSRGFVSKRNSVSSRGSSVSRSSSLAARRKAAKEKMEKLLIALEKADRSKNKRRKSKSSTKSKSKAVQPKAKRARSRSVSRRRASVPKTARRSSSAKRTTPQRDPNTGRFLPRDSSAASPSRRQSNSRRSSGRKSGGNRRQSRRR